MHPIRSAVLLIALALPLAATAGQTLTIPKNTEFAKGAKVPEAVRDECQLPQKVSEFVKEYADKNFDSVRLVDKVSPQTAGSALTMQIVDVQGVGGGAWSGPKSVTVEGKYYKDGKLAGTFRVARRSGGGAFGAYKNTCSILGRCTKAIGKDVAEWMQSPSMNAKLGDAK